MKPAIHLPEAFTVTQEQFEQLVWANRNVPMERTAEGILIIMSPTGGNTGRRNAGLTAQLWNWNQESELGEVFDSSTIFRLPNGADRSPDTAWVALERWQALTPEEQDGFPPLCPDFVVELRSKTDSLKELQNKMQEYLENGCHLGWLINPQNQQVEIYRPGQPVEILRSPQTLSGEDVLPGFAIEVNQLF
ncbi:MAG: Uma2 family endonuclease [Leptolyngbyaceae cyanobacterium]